MIYDDGNGISEKSHLLTGLLCILFGYLGVHRFYVGKFISGTIYLVIAMFTIPVFLYNILIGYLMIGLLTLLEGVDLCMIYFNMFDDGKGHTISPDAAYLTDKKEPLLPLIFFGVLTLFLLVLSIFNRSFFGLSMISLFIAIIFLIKELVYLFKK